MGVPPAGKGPVAAPGAAARGAARPHSGFPAEPGKATAPSCPTGPDQVLERAGQIRCMPGPCAARIRTPHPQAEVPPRRRSRRGAFHAGRPASLSTRVPLLCCVRESAAEPSGSGRSCRSAAVSAMRCISAVDPFPFPRQAAPDRVQPAAGFLPGPVERCHSLLPRRRAVEPGQRRREGNCSASIGRSATRESAPRCPPDRDPRGRLLFRRKLPPRECLRRLPAGMGAQRLRFRQRLDRTVTDSTPAFLHSACPFRLDPAPPESGP